MGKRNPWQSRYVFFTKIVEEECPLCGAKKLMHYSWADLSDDSGHYRACLSENCTFYEWIGFLQGACQSCNYQGEEIPQGPIQVNLSCPAKVVEDIPKN